MKSKIGKSLFNHIGLKILSLILAVLLWVIIMNVADYSMTKTIRNIDVEQVNGSSIEDMGKVYNVENGEYVDIVVKGPKSVVDQLTAADFTATADLSELSLTNSVKIRVSARDSQVNNRIEINCVDDTMNLTIEDKIAKELPIKAVANGDVAEGYAVGAVTVTPNIIRISGPESIVNRVTEVRASLDARGVSASLKKQVEPLCINAYGESMADRPIELSVDEVTVDMTVYPTKTVPVVLNGIGTPADGYSVLEVNYNPQEITIAGPDTELATVNAIYANDISVEGLSENKEMNLQIADYLPEGVILADSNKEVAVSIIMEQQQEREIAVSAEDIAIMGMNVAFDYKLTTSPGFKLRLKGLERDIVNVDKASLQLSVDVTDLEAGEHVMKVSYAMPKNTTVSVLGKATMTVTPREESTEEQNPEGGTTTDTQNTSNTPNTPGGDTEP